MNTSNEILHDLAQRYIESSRIVAGGIATPPGFFKLQLVVLAHLFSNNQETPEETLNPPTIFHTSTLQKRSEYLSIRGSYVLIHDNFMNLQSSFLNKLYYAIPEAHVIQTLFLRIASQRCIRHSYFGTSRFLEVPSLTLPAFSNYIQGIKQNLCMNLIQDVFSLAHEMIHFLVDVSPSRQAHYQSFMQTSTGEERLHVLFDVFCSNLIEHEEFTKVVKDPTFVLELYCDHNALLLTYMTVVAGKGLWIHCNTEATLYDLSLALLGFFINAKTISSIDAVVDYYAIGNSEADGEQISKAIRTKALRYWLRGVRLLDQLRILGTILNSAMNDVESWMMSVNRAKEVSDSVATNVIDPAGDFIDGHPIQAAFALGRRYDIIYPEFAAQKASPFEEGFFEQRRMCLEQIRADHNNTWTRR